MIFSKELALKAAGGLAAAAATSGGVYYVVDHYQNQLTVFDRGLIEHLNAGGKIKFAVLDNGGSAALSSFPTTFTNSLEKIIVALKIADSTTETTDGAITDKDGATVGVVGTKKYLKKLNGGGENGTDWTWKCEINLKKNANAGSATEVKDKDLIFKGSGAEALLDKLKETEEKDLKIKFIENCAKAREKDKNRKINGAGSLSNAIEGAISTAHELKSSKEFELRKGVTTNYEKRGAGKESESKLYFESETEFSTWFLA